MSSSKEREPALVVSPATQHTATVILLHGGGETGRSWERAVERFTTSEELKGVKFIMPNASKMLLTISKTEMTSWFDMKAPPSVDPPSNEDTTGILESRAYLHAIIQDEIALGISSERICFAGYSQGGSMGILAALTSPTKVAGAVSFSSWLLLSNEFKIHVPTDDLNKTTPVIMGFKDEDPQVRKKLIEDSEAKLRSLGYKSSLQSFTGKGHSVSDEELDAAAAFFTARFAGSSAASL